MKLKIFNFPTVLDLTKHKINIIEIEDHLLFRRIIETIKIQILNQEVKEKIWLYDDNFKEISSRKLNIVFDYLNLYSNIRIINPLAKMIDEELSEEKIESIQNINLKLNQLANDLLYNMDIDLSYQENYSLKDLLRMLKVKVTSQETIVDNLFTLIDFFSIFKKNEVLFFVNLKTFLVEEELIEFYNYIHVNQVPVVLLEGRASDKLLEREQKLIIDDTFDDHYQLYSTEI